MELVNDLLDAAKVDKGTSTSKLLERAAEAIERLEERVAIMSTEPDMRWVDAKERLPEKGVDVIGAVIGHDLLVAKPGEDLMDTLRRTRREVRYTTLASVDDEEGQLLWYGADGYPMMVQPSFWMALPKIPKGVKRMKEKTPELHILKKAVKDEAEEESLTALRKKMPPCPICGKKAYLFHDIVDGFDFGYSGGCPSFCLDDGVHGISESYDPEAPKVDGYSAREAFDKWIAYCARKEGEVG